MEPSPCDSIPLQDSENTRYKTSYIINRRSADTFPFISSSEKRKKNSGVSLPRLPTYNPRARSTDICQLPSKTQQLNHIEKLRESQSSKTLNRDVSFLQDILTKLPTDRDKSYKELIVGKQDSTYFLPTDINKLEKLLSNTDNLGMPITMIHYGLPEHLSSKKKKYIDKAYQESSKYRSKTPSPIRSPRHYGDKFIDKILTSDPYNEKRGRLKYVDLGNPTGRQDVENLKKWLGYMQDEYLGDIDNSMLNDLDLPDNILKIAYTIYYTTLKELLRQVSVHCIERGELLRQTVEKLSTYWNITSQSIQSSLKKEKERYAEELNRLKNNNSKQFIKYQVRINELTEHLHNSKTTEEKQNKDIEFLKGIILDLQTKYRKAKQENRTRRQIKTGLPVRQGYHDGTVTQVKIMPVDFASNEEEKENESSSSIERDTSTSRDQDQLNLHTGIDIALQTEEDNIDILFPEENLGSNSLFVEHMTQNQFSLDKVQSELCINPKTSLMAMSETVTCTISQPSDLNDKLGVCPSSGHSQSSLSYIANPGLSETQVLGLTGRLIFIQDQNPALDRSTSKKQAIYKSNDISKEFKTKEMNQKQRKFDTIMEDKSPDKSASKKQAISKGNDTSEEKKTNEISQKQSKDNTSPIKRQKNAKGRDGKIIDKDSIQLSTEDIIAKEVFKQQTALLDVKKQLKTKKEKLNDIESKITQKSKQLENLNKPKNISKLDELNKSITFDPKSMPFQSQVLTTSPEPSKPSISCKNKSDPLKISSTDSNSDLYSQLSTDSLNFAKKLSKRFEGYETANELDKSTNFLNLIPKGLDTKSWRTGFNVGYDHGRKDAQNDESDVGFEKGFAQGYRKGISAQDIETEKSESSPEKIYKSSTQTYFNKLRKYQSIDETEENSEAEVQTPLRSQPESTFSNSVGFKEKNPRNRRTTKIIEFNFSSRDSVIRKSKPGKKILNKFLKNKRSTIYNYATLGKNMLYRLISSVYQTAVVRVGSGEYFDSLINLIYEDILHKYGFKNVADRKFKEFISSAIFHSECRRVKILLRLIGIGYAIDQRSFSELSCRLYMEVLYFMHHTHIGIIVASDESADKQMYPSLRAYQCLKEKFESLLEKSAILKIANLIENNSVPDPKRINKSGLVELELFMEGLMDAYEEYQDLILEGLDFALSALYPEKEPKFITKTDAYFLIRNINPYKYNTLQKSIDMEVQLSYKENVSAEEELIPVKSFKKFCMLNCCLYLKDLHQIYKPTTESYKLTLQSIGKITKEEALSVLCSLPDGGEVKYRTYSAAQWRKKVDGIETIHDADAKFLLWRLIEGEVNYLRSERGRA